MQVRNTREILNYCSDVGCKKCGHTITHTLIFAFFAGMFIALGAAGSLIASANFVATMPDFAKFIAGLVFPVGLMFVLLAGGELFTGNCLLFVSLSRKKITFFSFLKNLTLVWLFNFIGAIFVISLIIPTHTFSELTLNNLHKLAAYKVHASFLLIFLKGIGCNILVAGAVWLSYACDNMIGKIWAIWFPIMLFIVLGFDHVVANMFYLPAAFFSGANISLSSIFMNLLAATLGNMVGGCLVLAGLYELSFRK